MHSDARKILVCDDEDVVREVIEAALVLGGFEPLSAASGSEALKLFEAHLSSVSLAIVDRRMPGMDGVELIQRLRALRPELPILFASGGQERSTEIERLPGRPVGALHKPFRPTELLAAVARELAADGAPPASQV